MTITTEEAEECARGQDSIKESSQFPGYRSIACRAAATIRSLAAERDALQARVAELEGALERLARLGAEPYYGNSDGNMIARAALEGKKE